MQEYVMKEASTYTGVSERTLRTYRKKGLLRATKKGSQYFFAQEELDKVSKIGNHIHVTREKQQVSQLAIPIAPIHQDMRDILTLINEGFQSIAVCNSQVSEKAIEAYRQSVTPIINQVVALSAEQKETINVLSLITQSMLNNLIVLIKTPQEGIEGLTQEEILDRMIEGIPLVIPQEIKANMIQFSRELAKVNG